MLRRDVLCRDFNHVRPNGERAVDNGFLWESVYQQLTQKQSDCGSTPVGYVGAGCGDGDYVPGVLDAVDGPVLLWDNSAYALTNVRNNMQRRADLPPPRPPARPPARIR